MNRVLYHILAVATIVTWGTTFVSTKVLIQSGLTPEEICLCRFILAYICIWIFGPKRVFAKSVKDELTLALLGVTGGTIYFWTENTALEFLPVADVTFLTSGTPIFMAVIMSMVYKDVRLTARQWLYSFVALIGVAIVIYSGAQGMHFSLIGDLLCIGASLSWCVYSIFVRMLGDKYPTLFMSRKIFLYGSLSLIPFFLIDPFDAGLEIFTQPKVWGNLLFLGIVASMVCFTTWNLSIKKLGPVITTNYMYINPVISILSAMIILGESVSLLSASGCLIILGSVYLIQKK
ncbi:MAG: DMT family transporter [Marinifilaceae bacterium]|nr:DMT family transporter [Marinifilaceae bacterium]